MFNFVKFVLVIALISSCSYYIIDNRVDIGPNQQTSRLQSIKNLYILETPGNSFDLEQLLYESLVSDGYYQVTKDVNLADTASIQADIVDYKYWEQDLTADNLVDVTTSYLPQQIALQNPLISNAKANVRITIKNNDGLVLYTNNKEVAFQQIYIDPDEIKSRPDGAVEIKRLVALALDRLIYVIDQNRPVKYLYFETGVSNSWYRKLISLLNGDITITKGIRFAQGEKWEYAITAFKKAAFEPVDENDTNFIENRASAYFNIGQIYMSGGVYDKAATYYSYANLTARKLHYAQSWADANQAWLDIQNNGLINQNNPVYNELLSIKDDKILPQAVKNYVEPDYNYLLKQKVLWPNKVFIPETFEK